METLLTLEQTGALFGVVVFLIAASERIAEIGWGAKYTGFKMFLYAQGIALAFTLGMWGLGLYIPGLHILRLLPFWAAVLLGLLLVGPIGSAIHPLIKALVPGWQAAIGGRAKPSSEVVTKEVQVIDTAEPDGAVVVRVTADNPSAALRVMDMEDVEPRTTPVQKTPKVVARKAKID